MMRLMFEKYRLVTIPLMCIIFANGGRAENLSIQSFDGTGRLAFNQLNNGTNYNYRVEWAPSPAGPWSTFGGAGAVLDAIPGIGSGIVTSIVPMCYRVVATLGDYMAVDISGGTNAANYPVRYYRSLADVPDGPNSDAYKTTNFLMRCIPKGTFTMGSPSEEVCRDPDETQHSVTLTKDFYISVFQVTQRQWELVMGNKPSYFNNAAYYQMRPVEEVSFYDIRENASENSGFSPNWPQTSAVGAGSFVGRLRAKTGLSTFDLPTESQWEYACRAGSATALNSGYNLTSHYDPRMFEVGRCIHNLPGGYPSGSDVSTDGGTAKVGSYLPNVWGLYDMHGNVWEWCLDWYGTYPESVQDPFGAASGSRRVIRGGRWNDGPDVCRSASRGSGIPDNRSNTFGFRVVRTLP